MYLTKEKKEEIFAEYGKTTLIPQRDSAALLFASVAWVNMPLIAPRYQFANPIDIPCDVTIDLDVNSPYGRFLSPNGSAVRLFPDATVQNDNYPMYMFELTVHEVSIGCGRCPKEM